MSETQTTNAQQGPSKEEIIKFLQEQIEVKKVQVDLQDLNTRLAVSRAEELKALAFVAQLTNPQPQGAKPHTVTQEDLDNNPDLVEAGIEVGEEIMIPDFVEEELKQQAAPAKKLKKETAK